MPSELTELSYFAIDLLFILQIIYMGNKSINGCKICKFTVDWTYIMLHDHVEPDVI